MDHVATTQKPVILVVGSANIDLNAKMTSLPRRGETILEESYEYTPGGKGANAACTVEKIGGQPVFCTRLGNDTHGQRLLKIYKDSGFDTRFVAIDKHERTGLAIVLTEQNGDNRIIVYPSANRNINREDVEDALSCCPDAMYLQLEVPEQTAIEAVGMARKKGIPVFVDAGPARSDYALEKFAPVTVFSPNEEETYAFTGIRPSTIENCFKACQALSQRVRAEYYILKLGSRGVFYYDGKYHDIITACNVDAVDTTAAGDVFTAALTTEYMLTGDMKHACHYGCIAGAIAVSRSGAFVSVPSAAEIKDFAERRTLPWKL